MALAWSVLSVGQGPTSTVHMVLRGSGFSAAEAARSLLLAALCDGDDDTAGSCLVAAGSAGRGGLCPGTAAVPRSILGVESARKTAGLAETRGRKR